MIRIPQVQLEVPQGQAPTSPFSNVTDTPVTSDPGRDLQQMAGTIANVGARLASLDVRAVEQANAGKARQAQGRLREALANQLEGEGGFLHLLGEDAVDGRVEALKKIDDVFATFSGEDVFDNDVQRQLFTQGTQADILRAQIAVQSHGSKQARVFNASTAKATFEADTLEIARVGWSQEGEKRLRADVDAYREASGIPDAQAKLLLQVKLSEGLSSHIKSLIEAGEFDAAQDVLDKAYDPAGKDGDKRDKLIGASRATLNVGLKAKKEVERKTQEAEHRQIERTLVNRLGEELGANIMAVSMGENPDLGVAGRVAKGKILGRLNDGLISKEAARIAFGAVDMQMIGFTREDEEKRDAATGALQQYASTVTVSSLAEFNDNFANQNPEAHAFLTSSATGREQILATTLQVAKGLAANEAAAQKVHKAEVERQFRDYMNYADDETFMQAFPANAIAKLRTFASQLSESQEKQLKGRWAEVHDSEEFKDDRLIAKASRQIEAKLTPFDWALDKTQERSDGSFPVKQTVLDDIQNAWTAYQRDVLKKEPDDLGNNKEFQDWFEGIAKLRTEDTFDMGSAQISRGMLRMVGGSLDGAQATRDIGGETYVRGSAGATKVGGIDTNALDLIANLRSGISLPFTGDRGGRRLSPTDMRNAERLLVGLGRPTAKDLSDPKKAAGFREQIRKLEEGGREQGITYATASQLVDPELVQLFEETRNAEGVQSLTETELLAKLREQVETEVELDQTPDTDDNRKARVESIMSKRTAGLSRLLNATPLWTRWQDLLRREKEGTFYGLLPAVGTRPAGWGSRGDRPFYRYPYSSYGDFANQMRRN